MCECDSAILYVERFGDEIRIWWEYWCICATYAWFAIALRIIHLPLGRRI